MYDQWATYLLRIEQASMPLLEPAMVIDSETLHDSLLQMTMVLLDTMEQDKAQLKQWYHQALCQPCTVIKLMPLYQGAVKRLWHHMNLGGVTYTVKNTPLVLSQCSAVYSVALLKWFRDWLGDTSPDHSHTLMRIDQELRFLLNQGAIGFQNKAPQDVIVIAESERI